MLAAFVAGIATLARQRALAKGRSEAARTRRCRALKQTGHDGRPSQRSIRGVLDVMRAASQACTSASTQATRLGDNCTRIGKSP